MRTPHTVDEYLIGLDQDMRRALQCHSRPFASRLRHRLMCEHVGREPSGYTEGFSYE